MSARSERATSPTPCACTNISLMQLFHELKQKFPGVPDHVVSNTIELYCHDKEACETHLHSEVKASLTHAYHASSSAAARLLNELKVHPPGRCRNQPITKHEANRPTALQSTPCQGAQIAVLSNTDTNHTHKKPNTDANQNVVDPKHDESERRNNTSPVTVINIDNCYAKYSAESPSDLELTNESSKEEKPSIPHDSSIEQPGSTNYRILKSSKIRSNLHERLEKGKEKKTIKRVETPTELKKELLKEKVKEGLEEKAILEDKQKEVSLDKEKEAPQENLKETDENLKETSQDKLKATSQEDSKDKSQQDTKGTSQGDTKDTSEQDIKETSHGDTKETSQEKPKEVVQEKPTRPNTLNFIKQNPDIAFKPTLKEPEVEPCRTVSPAPKQEVPPKEKLDKDKVSYRPERGYPLNLSVNVNCHMDYSRGYDPWLEDYDSPRAITSVNLTVCTPTSNMASPVREPREDDGGFEGHVTVTVSPSTARAPRRPAPPPPSRPSRLESPRPTRAAPEPPGSTNDRSNLIERQKERLGKLAAALAQEKSRLTQLARETQILAAPPPPQHHAQRLREYVEKLRDQCNTLSKRLEMGGNEQQEPEDNFYSNIYTGQRPPTSWQCHMCTFRNHPLLDKCEECDMPRIFVGMSHDSGFGSFRDRNRKLGAPASTNVPELTDFEIVKSVQDIRALQLNS